MGKVNFLAQQQPPDVTKSVFKVLPKDLQQKVAFIKSTLAKPSAEEARETAILDCLTTNACELESRSRDALYVCLEMPEHAKECFEQQPCAILTHLFKALDAIYEFEDLKREKQLARKIQQVRKQTLKDLQWQQLTTSLKSMLTSLFEAATKFFGLYLAKTKFATLISGPGLTRSALHPNASDLSLAVWRAIPNIFGHELDAYGLPCNRERIISLLGPMVKVDAKNSLYQDSLVIKILLDTELFLAEFAQTPDKIELLNQLFAEWEALYTNATLKRLELANAAMAKAKQEIIDEFALQEVELTKEAKQLVQATVTKICDNILAELTSK